MGVLLKWFMVLAFIVAAFFLAKAAFAQAKGS